ncbi:MAG TPA: GGDEF domain-containing protein, partial [Planctomycetota bacterium]|nr:GGDEF domain-containing protein [Planctomycetota bacterium]
MSTTLATPACLAVGDAAAAALRRLSDPSATCVPDVYAAIHALRGDGARPVLVAHDLLADHPRRALRALREAASPHPVVCLPPARGGRLARVERAARDLGVHLPSSPEEALEALSGPRPLPGASSRGRRRPAGTGATEAPGEVAFADGCLRRLSDVGDLERYVVRTLSRAAGARRASLLRFEPGRAILRLRAARGLDPALVGRHATSPGCGVAGRVAVLGKSEAGRGVEGGPRGYRGTAWLALPLGRAGACEGVACLTDFSGDRAPDRALVRTMTRMARRAGRALIAASRLSRAEALSTIDELTGLPNRRAFERLLARDAERVRRGHGTLAIALFDVDRFKAVNDTHGHAIGDRVLVAVARR